MNSLYKVHEILKVVSSKERFRELNEREVIVLAKRRISDEWVYLIQTLDTLDDLDIEERELASTGRMLKSPYDFNEIVIIDSSNADLSEINGKQAFITGMSRAKDNWYYSVQILPTDINWCVYEYDLKALNMKRYINNIEYCDSIVVTVNGETGGGEVKK